MPEVRKYIVGFLYRTAAGVCLLLLCYIIHELWPAAFEIMRSKLFYSINYGQLAKDLTDLARCVLPR